MTSSQNKNYDTCSKLFARETTSSATALKKYIFQFWENSLWHGIFERTLDNIYLDNVFAVEVVSPDLIWGISCSNIQVTWAIRNIDLIYFLLWFFLTKMWFPTLAKSWKAGFWVGSVLHMVSVSRRKVSAVLAVHRAPSMFSPHLQIYRVVFFKNSLNVQRRKGNRFAAIIKESPSDTILFRAIFKGVAPPSPLQVDVQLRRICQVIAGNKPSSISTTIVTKTEGWRHYRS